MTKQQSTKGKHKKPGLFKNKQPQTLLQLTGAIIIGFIKSIPKHILYIIVIGLIAFLFHTYLVIYPNGGFSMGTNRILDKTLALVGNRARGTILWTVGSYLIFGLLRRSFTLGPVTLAKGVSDGIKRVVQSLTKNTKSFIMGMILPLVIVLVICLWIIKNDMLAAMFIAGAIISIITYKSGLSYHVIRLGYQDMMRIFRKKTVKFQDGNFDKLMIAVILGMFLYRLLYDKMLLLYGCVILLFGLFVIGRYGKGKGIASNIFFVFMSAFQIWILFALKAYADDGGVAEAGGLANWLTSEGAMTAVGIGIPPALGSILGGLLGVLTGDGSMSDLMSDIGELSEETIEEVSDFLDDFAGELPFDLTSLFGGPDENPYTSMLGGNGPGMCQGIGLPNYWVNTSVLNLIIVDYIFKYKGLGPEVEIKLNYNSMAESDGILGKCWRLSYESQLHQKEKDVLITKGSNQQIHFSKPEVSSSYYPIEYVAFEGCYDRLLEYDTYWRYADKSSNYVYQYDKGNKNGDAYLTAILDYNSNKISFSYNGQNRIESIADASGRTINIEYGNNNLCNKIIIPDGREAVFHYDTDNRLTEVADLQQVVSRYVYDEQGDLTKMIVGSRQGTTQFSYIDLPWGRGIKTLTDARGIIQSFELVSDEPRKVSHLDGDFNLRIYTSHKGLTTEITDPAGKMEKRIYKARLPVEIKDKNGNSNHWKYDLEGNVIQRRNPLGGKEICKYDEYGNLVEQTNDREESHRMEYDRNSNILAITSPMGYRYSFEYDELGQLVKAVDPEGHEERYSYDKYGNIQSATNGVGATMMVKYSEFGYLKKSITDPNGNKTVYMYDDNNRLTKITYPDLTSKQFTYDCCSRKTTTDELGRRIIFERDEMLNVTKYIDANGNIQSMAYDHDNKKTKALDMLGNVTTIAFDMVGRLEELRYGDRSVQIHYDDGDRMKSVEDADGGLTQFEYDQNNNIIGVINPMGAHTKWIRKSDGQLDEMLRPSGHEIKYEYDQDNLLTGKWTNGSRRHRFTYYPNGLLKECQKDSFDTSFLYDGAGQVKEINNKAFSNLRINLDYDLAGNLTRLEYPSGLQVVYTYDNRNRVIQSTWQGGGISFQYDAKGNLIGEVRQNQTTSIYQVDNVDRIVLINHKSKGEDLIRLNYSYDAVGNILQISGKELMSFMDGLKPNKINEKQKLAIYNKANQLLEVNDNDYKYDLDGNLIEVEGERAISCSYDEEGAMTRLNLGDQSREFIYDGFGNRVTVVGADTINMGYDGKGKMLYKISTVTGEMTSFIYAGDRLVAMVTNNGESYYYHFNNTGSSLALTDMNGQVANSYAYSPYGCKVSSQEKVNNPFTYIGAFGVTDEGNNIYLMKRRYYDAITGRFMQPDPVGFIGGINLYEYVGGNPMNRIDPEGTVFVFLTAALILGTFTAAGLAIAKGPTLLPDIERAIENGGSTAEEFLNDFGRKLGRIGDKILTVNPLSSPGWSSVKTFLYATAGDVKNALWNAPGAVANEIGSAWTFVTESYDSYFANDCGK